LIPAAQAQRLRIVVGGANFRPFPVAAPALIVQGSPANGAAEAADELTGILQSGVDLARSLELVPPKTYLAPEKEPWAQPVYTNWANVGASGLIRGAVELKGDNINTSLRFFDVIGQCFSIAQERMSDSWKRDADLVIEPNVDGFEYDCFDRAKELLVVGEDAMRKAIPTIRQWLEPQTTKVPVARVEVIPANPNLSGV
jgi:hypothetical protein